MNSFIRISDIPANELHLLPIIGLRQQIREDRSRPSSPDNVTNERQAVNSPPDPAQHPEAASREWPQAVGSFVTEWQLQDEPRPSARSCFDKEDLDEEEHGDEGSHDEDFGALYMDLGGEG
jgi:hypothetical protein